MKRTSALAVSTLTLLAACTPTPTPPSGAGASGGPTPSCSFAANQTSNDLRMNCPIPPSPLPNSLIDPASPGSGACSATSVSLFGQSMSASIAVIYGENGDENDERVRLGTTITNGRQGGTLAKSAPGCTGTVGPTVAVTTTFAGTHTALIDKSQTPACVFQSRMTLTSFDQRIGTGLTLPVGAVTESTVRDQIGRRLDLALATAINGLLQPSSNTGESGFVGRSGRCANNYQPFTGN